MVPVVPARFFACALVGLEAFAVAGDVSAGAFEAATLRTGRAGAFAAVPPPAFSWRALVPVLPAAFLAGALVAFVVACDVGAGAFAVAVVGAAPRTAFATFRPVAVVDALRAAAIGSAMVPVVPAIFFTGLSACVAFAALAAGPPAFTVAAARPRPVCAALGAGAAFAASAC
ncbi:MAG: hypothetical protein ACRD2W_04540 [Acidimicrobiales bacterium]